MAVSKDGLQYRFVILGTSIPRDDLVLALVQIRRIEQIAGAPSHQEFRPPCPDRVVAAAPLRRFTRLVFRQ